MQKIINLSDEASGTLFKLAQERGQSESELIREAIEDYLKRQTVTYPKSIGLGASGQKNLSERVDELLWQES